MYPRGTYFGSRNTVKRKLNKMNYHQTIDNYLCTNVLISLFPMRPIKSDQFIFIKSL